MEDLRKTVKLKTSQNKVIVYKQQGNIAYQLLVKAQNLNAQLDLQEVMTYQLTPVPYCLGTPDGFLCKTNKVKGFQFLTNAVADSLPPNQNQTLLIMDGNAIFHSMTEVPETFKGICEKVFKMIPGTSDVIFSTDMYKKNSIKALERVRRGCGDKVLVKGPSMKRPMDWKNFLMNDENKEQFTELLLKVWLNDSFGEHLSSRKVILID